jgi:hypothetical protein
MSNNNSVAVIVVGLLGFMAIAITGKWILEDKHEHHRDNCQKEQPQPLPAAPAPQVIVTPPPTPAPQVIVTPPPTQIIIGRPYPQAYPQYHSRNEFWQGYSDGWGGMRMRQNCPEYIQGYQIGLHDRGCHRPYYHEQHCPPGFSLRVPGFSLNIR